jgi:MFS family permease
MRDHHQTRPKTAVRRLAAARLISVVGGSASFTALMVTVYELTHSATWLAAALLFTFGVSGFLAPLGGAIADRFDRKRVMVVSDLLGAAVYVALTFRHGDPGVLLALAFVAAAVAQPFYWASGAAIPNLVREDELAWANSLVALGRNAGVMIGPAVGGALVGAIGPTWVFGLNAVTFAVSAALVRTIRADFQGSREDAKEHRGLRAGFVFVARDRVLRSIVFAWAALVAGVGFVMVADVPLAEHFHAGSLGYGLMIGTWGLGSVLGSLAGRKLNEEKEPRALFLGMALIALSTGAVAVSPWFAPILVMSVMSGFGDAITVVAEQGIQQRRTPDAVRSRVMAASEAVVSVVFALSLAFAGPVLRALGPQNVYAIGGATALVGATVLLPVVIGERRRVAEREPPMQVEAG